MHCMPRLAWQGQSLRILPSSITKHSVIPLQHLNACRRTSQFCALFLILM